MKIWLQGGGGERVISVGEKLTEITTANFRGLSFRG
jgi:hypothetical protein